ncbi:ribonuclease domain-containing protein [Nocardioides sp. SYSU D00038]|uniref:ribonuclease domain-containing protein n=1 Tax=Nocardioides sp. SYSU D00038 TaxID=2812554 RepID=UPI001966CEC0|nr:ribonuclease domain-containing protein [Nocardioides sp. SYSU D00038]
MRWDRRTVRRVAVGLAVVVVLSVVLWLRDGGADLVGLDPAGPGTSATAGSERPETGDVDDETGLRWVREEDLPVLAQGTLAVLDQGGPFPCRKDGAVFHNREGILPRRDRGYYREYTVIGPSCGGSRGTERIVTGGPEEFFHTADHYDSFERVAR